MVSGSGQITDDRWAKLSRLLRQEIVAVANYGVASMTASAVDARLVGQSAADEAVRENAIVLRAPPHAPHVIAVRDRIRRQVSRPALIGRRR